MLKAWETTVEQDAAEFAGLDSKQVFTDLAAGRHATPRDVTAAISEVKKAYPSLTEDLNRFNTRMSSTHCHWS